MNYRTIIQILLFLLIFVIFYIFYFIYFKKDYSENNQIIQDQNVQSETKIINKEELNNSEKEELTNIIEDVEYKSLDRKGNQYIVKAEIGKIVLKEKNIMKLNNVVGKIILLEREPIRIYSDYAEYNTINFDTKFYGNVEIKFEDNKVNSDNFDLFMKDNVVKIYNNVVLDNNVSKLNADILNIDLLNGDINVSMYDKSNKINFLKK